MPLVHDIHNMLNMFFVSLRDVTNLQVTENGQPIEKQGRDLRIEDERQLRPPTHHNKCVDLCLLVSQDLWKKDNSR